MHDRRIALRSNRLRGLLGRFPKALQSALILLVGIISTQVSRAEPSARVRLASLSVPGIQWGEGQEFELSHVPFVARPFKSTETAVHIARSLALHTELFQHALTLPGKIVLSGLDSRWHWLAQIETTAVGTTGQVSALQTEPFGSRPTRLAGFTWLPVHAARRFSHQMQSAGGTVGQYVYSVALSPSALTAYLRRQLRAEGWVGEPFLATTRGHSAWRRNGARLTLFPQPGRDGTTLYIHHAE